MTVQLGWLAFIKIKILRLGYTINNIYIHIYIYIYIENISNKDNDTIIVIIVITEVGVASDVPSMSVIIIWIGHHPHHIKHEIRE